MILVEEPLFCGDDRELRKIITSYIQKSFKKNKRLQLMHMRVVVHVI